MPIRKLAFLIGKIISTMNAIFPAHLYSQALLVRDKNLALKGLERLSSLIRKQPIATRLVDKKITRMQWKIPHSRKSNNHSIYRCLQYGLGGKSGIRSKNS